MANKKQEIIQDTFNEDDFNEILGDGVPENVEDAN